MSGVEVDNKPFKRSSSPSTRSCSYPLTLSTHATNPSGKPRSLDTSDICEASILHQTVSRSRDRFPVSALIQQTEIPRIRLPPPKTRTTEEKEKCGSGEDDESDDTDDVEELFLDFAHELDINDKLHHPPGHKPTVHPVNMSISAPSIFNYSSPDYFTSSSPVAHTSPLPFPAGSTPPMSPARDDLAKATGTHHGAPSSVARQLIGVPTSDQENSNEMKHGTPTSPSSSSPNPAFALRPPSHMNKSQRHSRALSNTDVIESMTVSPPRPPNPISAEDEPEKTNGSSAVSPRFMALRKLSEASMVSTGRKQSVAKPTSALESFEGFQNQLLRRIDDIIDGQLQSNLAQLLWKATQTQLDTRRFWEDQKKEMMEYSSNMLAKLQPHAKPPRMDEDRAQLAALQAQVNELKQENSGYRRKQIGLERELYEMNMIKARNVELERQCALVQKRNATLDHQYQEPGKSITETVGVHDPVIRVDHDYDLLLARNHELEAQIDRLNERIRDLESECTAAKQSKVSGNEDRDTDPLNETVSISDGSLHRWADEVNRVSPKGKTTTTEDSQVPDLQPLLERIASLEEENKHLRQMEDIHRIQIEHLQHPPAPAPAPTVKVREEFKDTIVVPSSNPKRGHNKQHRRSMPPRFPTRSMPVSRVSSPNTNEDGYSTDGEVLTFLTEINGQISRFTVKLPQHQSKESSNDRKRHTMNAKSRLNPHAPVWPAFE